jgi:hypothetical protein
MHTHTSSLARAALMTVEALECRAHFSVTPDPGSDFATAFAVGDLNGEREFRNALSLNNLVDAYKFSLPQTGVFSAAFQPSAATAEMDLFQETIDKSGKTVETKIDQIRPAPGDAGDLIGRTLAAGTYYAFVDENGADTPYLLRLTADYAGNTLKTARNIGSATDAAFADFVGSATPPSLNDHDDFYKFKMDASGQLIATMQLDNPDFAHFNAHLQIIRDANNNGLIDPGEILTASGPATFASLKTNLGAGTYFASVTSDQGVSNYRLSINADYADPGRPRAAGSLDTPKTFNDFIEQSVDTNDDYTFSLSGTRPFLATLAASGNAQVSLTVFKDANHNGVAETSERLITTAVSSVSESGGEPRGRQLHPARQRRFRRGHLRAFNAGPS